MVLFQITNYRNIHVVSFSYFAYLFARVAQSSSTVDVIGVFLAASAVDGHGETVT